MAGKTKNDLLNDIEALNKELDKKECEIRKYESLSACKNHAEEYKDIYDNYVDAGFTKDQALEILKIIIDRTINIVMYENTNYRRYNRRY